MRRKIKRGARHLASACAIALTGLASVPVMAGSTASDEAQASVVVVEPVGAGFSFDLMNDAVSAVFLSGDAGQSVSVLMSRRKTGPQNAPQNAQRNAQNGESGGVVVMASGVYRIDLLQPVADRPQLRNRALLRGMTPGGSSLLFLAQFN